MDSIQDSSSEKMIERDDIEQMYVSELIGELEQCREDERGLSAKLNSALQQ